MKRLGLTVTLLGVCICVALGLLVARALLSVSHERSMRHRAVAERAFDEMERSLTDFLVSEETRPLRRYLDPSASLDPAAGAAPRDFVLGYFQQGPDGRIEVSPRGDLDRGKLALEVREAIGRPAPAPEPASPLSRSTGLLEKLAPRAAAPAGLDDREADAPAQAEVLLFEEESLEAKRDASEPSDAYQALKKLNVASKQRLARQQAQAIDPAPQTYAQYDARSAPRKRALSSLPEAAAPMAPARGRDDPASKQEVRPNSAQMKARSMIAARSGPAVEAEEADASSMVGSLARATTVDEALPAEASPVAGRVRSAPAHPAQATPEPTSPLGPMQGRPAAVGHLLLFRGTPPGAGALRQGMLIDIAALGAWLRREVLEASGLSGLGRTTFLGPGGGTAPRASSRAFRFEHRFGEPFDRVRVVFDLDPFPGTQSAGSIYLLAGLASLLTLVGLAAVYRMVAARVRFAERRNDFVAAVSHELKTPLTSIRMYGEMLRDGLVASPEKQQEYYRGITDESERLSRLIDNVLEFSRLEKGNRTFDLRVGSVGAVVEEAVEKLRPHIEAEGFELRTDIAPSLPAVRYDRDAVLQILFNLVDNALKYARAASKRTIVVECRLDAQQVSLSVRDFGPGVARAQLARIFEPFHRGGEEATRATGGAGIGLSLVKDLAAAMGAALTGHNPDDGGFQVSLAFPLQPS